MSPESEPSLRDAIPALGLISTSSYPTSFSFCLTENLLCDPSLVGLSPDTLFKMLFSKTQTDVLEDISFIVTCYKHGSDACKELYLDRESVNVEKAKKLLKLFEDVKICEREAFVELIDQFAKTGLLPNEIVQILWEINL